MNGFEWAIVKLKNGARIKREGWGSNKMFIYMVMGSTFKVNRSPLLDFYPENTELTYRGHIDVRMPDGTVGVWTPNNIDILTEDWVEVFDAR